MINAEGAQKQELEAKLRQFLEELSTLTRKYHIQIGGCGCCGSPDLFLLDNKADGTYEIMPEFSRSEDLEWNHGWVLGRNLGWVTEPNGFQKGFVTERSSD